MTSVADLPPPSAADEAQRLAGVRAQLAQAWLGDPFVLDLLLVTVLAGGHLLLEDVPGVGKTTLAKALARALGVEFRRVQFTSDLLPADVLGGSVYRPADGRFEFVPGPVFTELLLADEVNRAPTRSQSAFLQAMEEGHVAVDGVSHALPALFTVIATQNPIDYDSTNPLPEAQLDRFLIATQLGYPGLDDELALLGGYPPDALERIAQVLAPGELLGLRARSAAVHLHADLARYIVTLARATRTDARLRLGISPRGALHLAHAGRALALLRGRSAVLPEDLQALIHPVWAHRLLPRQGRDAQRSVAHALLTELVAATPVPR